MLLGLAVTLLGLVSGVASAAVLSVRQDSNPSTSPATELSTTYSPCTPIYRFITVTVTDTPDTVTIALVNSSSIDHEFSIKAYTDTIEVVQKSQAAPFGFPRPTEIPVYTHTAAAPLVEATEVQGDGSSVYYIPKAPNGTQEVTPVAVTTVTVIPTPASTKRQPNGTSTVNDTVSSTINLTSIRTATTTQYAGWNSSVSGIVPSSAGCNYSTASFDGPGYGTGNPPSEDYQVLTTTVTAYDSTTTIPVATKTTIPFNGSFEFDEPSEGSTTSPGLVPRQTCTEVDAGRYGKWCNNWDGSQVISFSTYETTVTPPPKATRTPLVVTTTVTAFLDPPPPSATPVNTVVSPGLNSTAPTEPQSCGEVGNFTIDFENFPESSSPNPPIFNPFRHFWWGSSWTYAPPPVGKYLPHDGTHLAVSIPTNDNTLIGSPNAGDVPASGFGAGPRRNLNSYWFNASSAYIACDSAEVDPDLTCIFNVYAWHWTGTTEVIAGVFSYPIKSCADNTDCHLQKIQFPENWHGLTTLNFSATFAGERRGFYMDALQLGWYNNTCAAGLQRISQRKRWLSESFSV